MRQNLARWDRLIRLAAFAVLLPLGVLVVTGVVDWFAWLGAALVAAGLIMSATAATGYCPIEHATGIESGDPDGPRSDPARVRGTQT